MHEENRRCTARTLIDIVNTKHSPVTVGDLGIVRMKRVPGEVLKSFVRRA
jgi:hypothetical protein